MTRSGGMPLTRDVVVVEWVVSAKPVLPEAPVAALLALLELSLLLLRLLCSPRWANVVVALSP